MAEVEVGVGDASAEKGTPPPPEKAKADEPEFVCVELPAPAGWTKKFLLNEDASPRKNEIVFISPTGEEIKNKRHLQQYLKSHPGGPPSSEFDWGTGDTPRRSARIRERAKTVDTPEDEKPKKREKKSSSKKATKDKKDNEDGFDVTSEAKEDSVTGEAKASTDVEMQDTEDENKVKAENENKVNGEALTTGTEVNEVIATEEIAVNEDTSVKVANEGAGESNSTLETNRNDQEKTAATEEIAANEDTSVKVANEGAGEPNSTLETNRNDQEKTAATEEIAANENKVNGEALTTGTEVNEVIATEEIAANEDTSVKVANEGAGDPNSTLETSGNDQEKTAANLGDNDAETATEADKPTDSKNLSADKDDQGDPAGNSIQEDSVSAAPKDVPSGNSGDAQHLPKASPIKT